MTLSEVLHDDDAALQAGIFALLPHRDLSGRLLLFVDRNRLTYEGYDADSMVSDQRHKCSETIFVANDGVAFLTHELILGSSHLVFNGGCSTTRQLGLCLSWLGP